MLNLRKDIVNEITMRGVLAFNEDGRLGVITTKTKVDGKYEGVDPMTRESWTCESPTLTCGTVAQWGESGESLFKWLQRHGAGELDQYPANASDRLVCVAREAGLL